MRSGARDHNSRSLKLARHFRATRSASENVLWDYLRKDQLGFRFRTQYRLAGYFLDFYCPEAKLCVEVDGDQHCVRAAVDELRDEKLTVLGVLTYRVPSLELFESDRTGIYRHLSRILALCEDRTGRKGNAIF